MLDSLLSQLEVYTDVGHNLGRSLVERVLGASAVAACLELGVLSQATHGRPVLHSNVQLTPYDDGRVHVATDFYQVSSEFWQQRGLDPVMALGFDTAGLVYGAPREQRRRRLLDLCTGSGIQAITAAMHYADDVTLVDINPRAARFARFNVLLNGLAGRARVHVGSLYEALAEGTDKFDAILANPPYLPTLEEGDETPAEVAGQLSQHLFGAGGRFGHAITRRVVSGAGRWLRDTDEAAVDGGSVVRLTATVYNLDQYEGWLREWWHGGTTRAAELRMHTGSVWSREYMLHKRMPEARLPGIHSGANTLIWIRQLPRARSGAEAAATTFHRSQLHGFLWQVLNSETGLRPLMQALLRADVASIQPDYSRHVDSEGRPQEAFAAAWRRCVARLALPWLRDCLDVRLRELPVLQQDKLVNCVNARLKASIGANAAPAAARDEL